MSDILAKSLSNIHTSAEAMNLLGQLEAGKSGRFTRIGHKEEGEVTMADIMGKMKEIANHDEAILPALVGRVKRLTADAKLSTITLGFSKGQAENAINDLQKKAVNLHDPKNVKVLKTEIDNALKHAVDSPAKESFSKLHQLLVENDYNPEFLEEVMKFLPSEKAFMKFVKTELQKYIDASPASSPIKFSGSNLQKAIDAQKDNMTPAMWKQVSKFNIPEEGYQARCYFNAALQGDEGSLSRLNSEASKGGGIWRPLHNLLSSIYELAKSQNVRRGSELERTVRPGEMEKIRRLSEGTQQLEKIKKTIATTIEPKFLEQLNRKDLEAEIDGLKSIQKQLQDQHKSIHGAYKEKLKDKEIQSLIKEYQNVDLYNDKVWLKGFESYLEKHPTSELKSFKEFIELQHQAHEIAGITSEMSKAISQLEKRKAALPK